MKEYKCGIRGDVYRTGDFESHSATDLLLKTSYEVIIFLHFFFFRIKLTYHLEKRVIYDMASRSTETACASRNGWVKREGTGWGSTARLAGILAKIGVFFVSKMFPFR